MLSKCQSSRSLMAVASQLTINDVCIDACKVLELKYKTTNIATRVPNIFMFITSTKAFCFGILTFS